MQNEAARQLRDFCRVFTCDEFHSLSQPYAEALCHFFFFPRPVLPTSPGLSPSDTAVTGNRGSVLSELQLRSLSLPPGNQGVKMTDMDALSVIDDSKKSWMLFIAWHCLAEGGQQLDPNSSSPLLPVGRWPSAGAGLANSHTGLMYVSAYYCFSLRWQRNGVLCRILRLKNFRRENRHFVLTRLRASSSAGPRPEVVVNEWKQASRRSQLTHVCALVDNGAYTKLPLAARHVLSWCGCPCCEEYRLSVPSRQVLGPAQALGLKKVFSSVLLLVECWLGIAFNRSSRKRGDN